MLQRGQDGSFRPDSDGFYYPENQADISDLVKYAVAKGLKVRVRGASHSVPDAIYTSPPAYASPHGYNTKPPQDGNINIQLDHLMSIEYDDAHMIVTAGAGCHLGHDPLDPQSTLEKSLFYRIQMDRGWALPDTGGIIHQTVGGFISTGSSGSSIHHSLGLQIVKFSIVDGNGDFQEFTKADETFFALGVSLGLLGIITAVSFQCIPTFNISGTETTSTYELCEIDLFGENRSGKPDLKTFFYQTDHTRLMWFPQPGLERMIVWQAKNLDHTPEALPSVQADQAYHHYHEFPDWMHLGQRPSEQVINWLLRLVDVLNPPLPTTRLAQIGRTIAQAAYGPAAKIVLNNHTQLFRDVWWHGLPMDNGVDYHLMPTRFTELWIPVEQATDVMKTLRDHYHAGGFEATGTLSCEIYCTPSNDFWMSAAYQRDVVKVDPFWFGYNQRDPDDVYFPQFWKLLEKFDYRLHWAKALPSDPASVQRLKDQYPRWDDFMALRAKMDPHGIFLTAYWKQHLGIE